MTATNEERSYQQFKGWMSEFDLGANDEIMQGRWKALTTLAEEIGAEDIETLVRLALKTRQTPEASRVEKIVEYFSEDEAFTAAKNARELQVLSAAALVLLASSETNAQAPRATLSLLSSQVAGARKHNLPMDLLGLATEALGLLSRGVGRRPSIAAIGKVKPVSFEQPAKAIASNDWGNASQGLTAAGAAVSAAFQYLSDQTAATCKQLAHILNQQDEELQMLWWLLGGRSEDLNVTFDKVAGDKQALVLAKELADHTTLPPGPASVPALLMRAGLKSRGPVEVAAAICACDASWLAPLVNDVIVSPVRHPIHFGVQRQLEVGHGNDWIANWAGVTGLKADLAFAPLVLGQLFYRERLLLQGA